MHTTHNRIVDMNIDGGGYIVTIRVILNKYMECI